MDEMDDQIIEDSELIEACESDTLPPSNATKERLHSFIRKQSREFYNVRTQLYLSQCHVRWLTGNIRSARLEACAHDDVLLAAIDYYGSDSDIESHKSSPP